MKANRDKRAALTSQNGVGKKSKENAGGPDGRPLNRVSDSDGPSEIDRPRGSASEKSARAQEAAGPTQRKRKRCDSDSSEQVRGETNLEE